MDEHSKGPQPQPQAEERGLQNGDPWLVQVDVYLEDDTTTPPTFRVESCLPNKVRQFGGRDEKYLVFENNLRPGFKILFQLHDLTTHGGYTFPRRPDDAVWSKIGEDCPHAGTSEGNEVFDPVRIIEPDRTTLVVRFENTNPIGDFRYTLNVTKTGERPFLELDPGGTGMNGQSSPIINS